VERTTESDFVFHYYKVGSRDVLLSAPPCMKTPEMPWRERAAECTHEWLVLRSSIVGDPEKARQDYLDWREHPIVEELGLLDGELRHAAYGENWNWCWKCGLYLRTSPSTERNLPITGTW
jgi:hypothetical protein